MTQEDKELLFKDLSARLPYHPIIYGKIGYTSNEGHLTGVYTSGCTIMTRGGSLCHYSLYELKPYLRPMSSMTDDERKYIEDKCAFTTIGPIGGRFCLAMPVVATEWLIDFYNSHHLDWRGLIPMGLALEAPEGMYN